ncbi:MAG: glycosyltransferase [Phycisphaerales bacterium]|nr:glycosyltransferase [Phycisphaerales bacterium]
MTDTQPMISVVSPVYRGEAMVATLVDRLRRTLDPLGEPYEILLVEDCSPDRSWDEIVRAARGSDNIRGIRLSRNFGQHYAISA